VNIWAWILVAAFAVSAVITVAYVGRPRDITTPTTAAIVLVIDAVFVWIVFKAVGAA